jgi:hypothetical protein
MRLENPERRLLSLWGAIDRQHYTLLAARVKGQRALDVGSGQASLGSLPTAAGEDA